MHLRTTDDETLDTAAREIIAWDESGVLPERSTFRDVLIKSLEISYPEITQNVHKLTIVRDLVYGEIARRWLKLREKVAREEYAGRLLRRPLL